MGATLRRLRAERLLATAAATVAVVAGASQEAEAAPVIPQDAEIVSAPAVTADAPTAGAPDPSNSTPPADGAPAVPPPGPPAPSQEVAATVAAPAAEAPVVETLPAQQARPQGQHGGSRGGQQRR